jgi:NAD dependent epimerase/dehydratase family enzyme
MNVLISGASGLVGTALIPALVSRGDRVIRLVRHPFEAGAPEIEWRPGLRLDPEVLEGFDAVIHLAGENIFGRWTEEKKRAIRKSRVGGAQTLVSFFRLRPSDTTVPAATNASRKKAQAGKAFLPKSRASGKTRLRQPVAPAAAL